MRSVRHYSQSKVIVIKKARAKSKIKRRNSITEKEFNDNNVTVTDCVTGETSNKIKKTAALRTSAENTFSEKHYNKKILSNVVLLLTKPNTQAALAIWVAREILCFKKLPALSSVLIVKRDLHRSFKNSSVDGPADP